MRVVYVNGVCAFGKENILFAVVSQQTPPDQVVGIPALYSCSNLGPCNGYLDWVFSWIF
jgi:hypothetical protein